MITHDINFVEFDRQWRGLFDDGCDYELMVNEEAAKREQHCLKIPTDNKGGFRYWVRREAALFLDWAHTRKEEVTLVFRKKPEPLPEGWRRVEGFTELRRNVQTTRISSTSLWMYATELSIHSYLGSVQLVRKVVDGLTPAQAAKQCEEATLSALHELIREITHEH